MPKPPATGPSALVLQGGGALGAYQAGVYEALASAGWQPDWVAGISIGAVNAALIAGNPPERRVEALATFWNRVTARLTAPSFFASGPVRRLFSEVSAGITAATGLPGFFTPRFPPPALAPRGTPQAISFYDTAPLRETLGELVDFSLINSGKMRFSVGAVNVETGNFVYFDNREREITVDHIMASGALPPAFAPVMIDDAPYWDGGIVSNTPLQHVLDQQDATDSSEPLTVFQVDLFPARGKLPRTVAEAVQREKDIRFSSRTRLNTDKNRELADLRAAARRLVAKLPAKLRDDPDARLLGALRDPGAVIVLQLINRSDPWETEAKDYEFSRVTIDAHWDAGIADVETALADPRWAARTCAPGEIVSLDLTNPAGHAAKAVEIPAKHRTAS